MKYLLMLFLLAGCDSMAAPTEPDEQEKCAWVGVIDPETGEVQYVWVCKD